MMPDQSARSICPKDLCVSRIWCSPFVSSPAKRIIAAYSSSAAASSARIDSSRNGACPASLDIVVNLANTQSDGMRRPKIVTRDKPVASHVDAGSGADPEAGATNESALRWRRCRNPRDAPSADRGGGERGEDERTNVSFAITATEIQREQRHAKLKRSATSSHALADLRGPESPGTELTADYGVSGPRARVAGVSLLRRAVSPPCGSTAAALRDRAPAARRCGAGSHRRR